MSSSKAVPFRQPTEHELREVFPAASRGWETQLEETACWLPQSAVQGELPLGLQGTFIRNGPGLMDVFGVPLAHPIDGDGMVVTLTFVNGRVHFRNRFTQTFSHREERAAGRMLYNGNMGSRVPGGKAKSAKMRDPAHTNAFLWGGKILACHEYALPHALDPVSLDTLGPDALNGHLARIKALSAHYRLDADADVLVAIGFRAGVMGRPPHILVGEFDRAWRTVRSADVSVPGLNYAHDFMLTPDWYMFHMTPFVDVSPEASARVMRGEEAPGEAMRHYPHLPSRIVLVQRVCAAGEPPRVVQLDTDPCHIYHFCNAVQQPDGAVTFGATCLPPGFCMQWQHKVFLSNSADAPGVYHVFRADPAAGTCTRHVPPALAARSNEFPTSNPYRHCVRLAGAAQTATRTLPPRFVYLMAGKPGVPMPFTDVVKYDEQTGATEAWEAEGLVGEPAFVPRLGAASAFHGADDDGWLIVQHYLPSEHRVEFVVLDAQRVREGPVARIAAPVRVPFGFHGTFTPDVFLHPPAHL